MGAKKKTKRKPDKGGGDIGPAAVRFGGMKLSAGWVMVTPEIAAGFLENNENPRPLREARVDAIAEDIAFGGWIPNGETIKLDSKGRLRDGQHRCAAIVEANKSCLCLVVHGVTDRGVERTDEGHARTYNDLLRSRGEKQVSQLGACVKMLRRILLYHVIEKRSALHDHCRPPNSSLDRVLEQNPGIREAIGLSEAAFRAKMGTRTNLSVMGYCFNLVDPKMFKDMYRSISTGELLQTDDPVLAYRARMISAKAEHEKIDTLTAAALLVKCWNAWRQQRGMKLLKWNRFGPSSEPFPLIDGLVRALPSRDK